MNEDRIKELFSNEDFVKELFGSKSYEEAQAMFADKDVDVSVDELKKVVELFKKKHDGSLSDEDLEQVAGGLGFFGAWLISAGISAAIGGAVAAKKFC